MERHFDQETTKLNEKLIRMASIVEEMIRITVKSLIDRNSSVLETINPKEKEINKLQIEIDEDVVTLIARMQPVATDLRFLIAASKINSDLERIADQVINIGQNTVILLKYPQLKPLVDIPIMADIVQQMVRESLDAYIHKDVAKAQKVLNSDDKVDALKDQIFRELLTYMISDPKAIQPALCLILIARNLERIGDHSTNIAEEVIYIVDGKDVRHHHEEQKRK
ncbi:MAG TPA: phosphate signaling complex protein PhoU [Planctomycetota bacterium]|nr:phosphate signaling complex protein PhoU [Planctomycetota bacterium]